MMNRLTQLLKSSFLEVLKDSDPAKRVFSTFKLENNALLFKDYRVPLDEFHNIYVFGAGKAAGQVALGLQPLLGDKITRGCVITSVEKPDVYGNIVILPGDHPLPALRSHSSSTVLVNELQQVTSNDLVLFITTGGASSMFCVPVDGLDWQDLRTRTAELLRSGKNIYHMNQIRSNWDKVKAGKTLRFAKPKSWINLLISDVPGDDPSVIGSGPAIATKSTPKSWLPEKYAVVFLDRPYEFALSLGAHINARSPDVELIVEEHAYDQDVNQVAQVMVKNAIFAHISLNKGQGLMVVYHGESTVKVTGDGNGGRNHHLGLLVLSQLDALLPNSAQFFMLSAGTDGMDGTTNASGIVCDRKAFQELVRSKGNPQAYISTFDSGSFFEGSECVINTGPTGTNLMDVQVIVIQA